MHSNRLVVAAFVVSTTLAVPTGIALADRSTAPGQTCDHGPNTHGSATGTANRSATGTANGGGQGGGKGECAREQGGPDRSGAQRR